MAPRLPDTKPHTASVPKSPDRSALKNNKKQAFQSPSAAQQQRALQASMTRLEISDNQSIHNSLTSSRPGLRFDDDQTQISCSSTKPASSDSRSATSGVTFAMDERESLRPDDSASTRAAEDEDSYSGPASGAPSSQVGSEAGGRAFQDQFNEITGRIGPGLHRLQSHRSGITGIAEETPQPALAPLVTNIPTLANGPDSLAINKVSSFPPGNVEPDDKLLEALESSKDRPFLIRLEQEVIAFVKDSTEPMLDLPPCNSFCRLLAHKMADYYALTHYVDNAVTSVRLYRTPYCRIPPPLSGLVKVQSPSEATPISQPSFQIMRREDASRDVRNAGSAANTTASSMAPSKAGSETGDDSQHGTGFASPTESVSTRERAAMSREEREAKYKETRERIFKGIVELDASEGNASSDATNGVSRTSSGNGKKKSKKSRRNNDDFEARSQFGIYYPTAHYSPISFEQMANPTPYYGHYPQQESIADQSGSLIPDMFQQNYNQCFNSEADAPAYTIGMQNHISGPEYNGPYSGFPMYAEYCQQYQPQYYQPMMQHQLMIGQHAPGIPSSALNNHDQLSRPSSQLSDPSWTQNGFPPLFQQSRQAQQGHVPQVQDCSMSNGSMTSQYPYGQLPFPSNIQQGRSQHPLPGSYNRSNFNPQTRAFIPSSSYQLTSNVQYNDLPGSTRNQTPPQTPMNGSSNSTLSQPSINYPRSAPFPVPSGANQSRKTSSQSTASRSAPQPSSLAKWGTPANLPPKPPPPEAPAFPESQHTLPANTSHVNIQPTMKQPMPNFQNGVYSMPSSGRH